MVVDCNRDDFFRFLLSDYILVKTGFYHVRRRDVPDTEFLLFLFFLFLFLLFYLIFLRNLKIHILQIRKITEIHIHIRHILKLAEIQAALCD